MAQALRVLRTGGLWFDGKTAYVVCPDIGDLPYRTYVFWAEIPRVVPEGATFHILVTKHADYRGGVCIDYLSTTWMGYVYFSEFVNGVERAIYSNRGIDDNKRHLIAASYDGLRLRIYIDGALDKTSPEYSGRIDANTQPVRIGGGLTGRYTRGIVDKVMIYNRALTADEIKAIYERGALIRDGLVLHLDFSEYEGNVAYDKSGCGNHATIYGARWVVKKALYRA
ncbi:MAG: LamG domain-containing protein [Thermofilaceae archaeon]